jgi:hypothetical protein
LRSSRVMRWLAPLDVVKGAWGGWVGMKSFACLLSINRVQTTKTNTPLYCLAIGLEFRLESMNNQRDSE